MKTIVVIEDQKTVQLLIRYKLENAGFNVVAFDDASDEAIKFILSNKVCLVLIDLMLGVRSGEELIVLMRSNKKTKNIPIIIISAKSTEKHIVHGFELGATDYITKPFSPNELLVRVKARLCRSTNERKTGKKVTKTGEENNRGLESNRPRRKSRNRCQATGTKLYSKRLPKTKKHSKK